MGLTYSPLRSRICQLFREYLVVFHFHPIRKQYCSTILPAIMMTNLLGRRSLFSDKHELWCSRVASGARRQVIGTSEIIVRPGLINVDFADVREVVKNSGKALIGIGTGTGKVREARLRLVASACCLYPPLLCTAYLCKAN